jgi:hypothetical protein
MPSSVTTLQHSPGFDVFEPVGKQQRPARQPAGALQSPSFAQFPQRPFPQCPPMSVDAHVVHEIGVVPTSCPHETSPVPG